MTRKNIKYTRCANLVDIAEHIKGFKYSEERKQYVLNKLHGYISSYKGIPIIIKPDNEIKETILPSSMISLLKQLEININEN